MSKGWIKLHRSLQDCVIWAGNEPYDRRSAWVDLLLLANHEDKEILFDYKPLTIMRGQYLTSVRQLGERWSWSKNRVLKYLKLLESLKMIQRESDTKRTLLTIVNYSVYQDVRDTDMDTGVDTGMYTGGTQEGHGYATNNNEKNDKNEKNKNIDNIEKYNVCFSEFWDHYPRKVEKAKAYKQYMARLHDGHTEEELLICCKNYAEVCKRNGTEQKYIKHGASFLSVNEPFLDYKELPKGEIKKPTSYSQFHHEGEREYDYAALMGEIVNK